jgi:hypothetical protein
MTTVVKLDTYHTIMCYVRMNGRFKQENKKNCFEISMVGPRIVQRLWLHMNVQRNYNFVSHFHMYGNFRL